MIFHPTFRLEIIHSRLVPGKPITGWVVPGSRLFNKICGRIRAERNSASSLGYAPKRLPSSPPLLTPPSMKPCLDNRPSSFWNSGNYGVSHPVNPILALGLLGYLLSASTGFNQGKPKLLVSCNIFLVAGEVAERQRHPLEYIQLWLSRAVEDYQLCALFIWFPLGLASANAGCKGPVFNPLRL